MRLALTLSSLILVAASACSKRADSAPAAMTEDQAPASVGSADCELPGEIPELAVEGEGVHQSFEAIDNPSYELGLTEAKVKFPETGSLSVGLLLSSHEAPFDGDIKAGSYRVGGDGGIHFAVWGPGWNPKRYRAVSGRLELEEADRQRGVLRGRLTDASFREYEISVVGKEQFGSCTTRVRTLEFRVTLPRASGPLGASR